jgi:CelD/BcsL family acetyltransferase involved in cellulose biosynthesis
VSTVAPVPCPEAVPAGPLAVRQVAFDAIPRRTWDALFERTPTATPFSRWTFHRAWWDAYGATAEPRYLVCCGADDGRVAGIAPLMMRPSDADAPGARPGHLPTTLFMGASYHADYATFLADPRDLPAVASAVATELRRDAAGAWDAVDLRRLRHDDPLLHDGLTAFRDASETWQVRCVQEDVCPVVTLPASGDWDEYLATLGKKARHEIRRKWRRAEEVGDIRFQLLPLDEPSVDAFVALHQKRWGAQGLFPDTTDGERSHRFLSRLTELEAAEGPQAQLQLGQVTVGEQVVFTGVAFDDGETCYFYNAGVDPEARELSPGVTGTAAYIRDRLAAGRTRFDFLRGDESYKYEWGAVDEPIGRIIITR